MSHMMIVRSSLDKISPVYRTILVITCLRCSECASIQVFQRHGNNVL